MVSLEDAVIARLEAGGHRFEILIDPNEAQAFKDGDEIDWEDSIAADGIWADSAKGERSPENILNYLISKEIPSTDVKTCNNKF